MKTAFFLFIFFIFNNSFTYGQEVEMDPVTVTATLTQIRASETGRNITIIKGDRFKDLPVHSIDELLRYIPGIEVQSRGGLGAQSDIVLRGGTYQQVLVILDGLRLNDPNTGHFSSYIPISPAEIERVEVLKGASSALYGADAVGGVINVITKTFSDREEKEISRGDISVAAGSYGTLNYEAGGFYSRNKWSVGGGVLVNSTDGEELRGINGFADNLTASLSANYQVDKNWSASYRMAYDKRHFAAQNFYTTFLSDTASEKVSMLWNQFRLLFKRNDRQWILDAGFKKTDDHYWFTPSSVPNENRSDLFQVRTHYQQKINSITTITGGLNFQQRGIRSNDRGNHSLFRNSVFLTASQKIGDGFRINPSLQWVFFQHQTSVLVPQVDFSYRGGWYQLRASAGKTIRDADFTERYNNNNKEVVLSGSVGNPDLKPEQSISYETGADFFISENLKLSSTFFQRFNRKLIDFSLTVYDDMPYKDNLMPSGVYALAKNISEVNSTGLETDLQFEKVFGHKKSVFLNTGLLWIDSRSSDAVPSFYVSSHAKFLANFSVLYNIRALSMSVNGLFKVRNQQEATDINAEITHRYFLLNTKVKYSFFSNHLSVFAQVDNIFNIRYSDLLGAIMPGRRVAGGVSYAIF